MPPGGSGPFPSLLGFSAVSREAAKYGLGIWPKCQGFISWHALCRKSPAAVLATWISQQRSLQALSPCLPAATA